MAADNTVLSTPVGTGETFRSLGDAGGLNWPGGWSCYPTTISPGGNVLQIVDLAHGLPVQPQTGATFPVSIAGTVGVSGPLTDTQLRAAAVPVSLASAPLPAGAATAANQSTEITSLSSIITLLSGTLTVGGTVAVSSLPSGLATGARQDTGNTSLASIDAKTPALGQALAAASVPVVLTAAQLASLAAPVLAAGGNLIGAVNTPAATSGGCSTYSFLSTAAVQAAAVKGSAGQVYGLRFFNKNASPVYVRLYDKATSPLTSDTPVYRAIVPGNTSGAGFLDTVPPGIVFTLGIGVRVTAAVADNDATALPANDVIGNVIYK